MELTSTQLRYLFAIYHLTRERTQIPSSAVADSLSVTRASTARMLNLLAEKGLVAKTRYSKLSLTPAGHAAATAQLGHYEQLTRILGETLALSQEQAAQAASRLLSTLPAPIGAPRDPLIE